MNGGFLKHSALALLAFAALGCARVSDADAVVIMPLGDSITWGWPSPGGKAPGGYRTALYRELVEAGLTAKFTGSQTANSSLLLKRFRQQQHEGHVGYTISDILVNLDGDDGRPDSKCD